MSIWSSFGRRWVALPDAAYARAAIGVRDVLTANRTYYVRTDGSDSNTGLANTAAGAFLTIQKAVDVAAALDFSIYNVTIQVGAGTYTAGASLTGPWVGSGGLTLLGDATTPSNVVISTAGNCVSNTGVLPAALTVNGFKMTSSGANCIVNNGVGQISFLNVDFGSAATRHISVSGGKVTAAGNYSISGGAAQHVYIENTGYVNLTGRTITFLASVNFSTAFMTVSRTAGTTANAMTFTYGAFSVTGTRYSVTVNGWIVTGGGGASYLPGDVAGSSGTGGQYT